MSYEDDQRTLLKLWEEVSDEESDIGSVSDDEPPDHISENSYHSDSEEELPEIPIFDDSQNNDSPEVSETEEQVDDHAVEQTTRRAQYLWGIDKKTKWTEKPGNLAIRTRRENIITHLPGPKRIAQNVKTPLDCWKLFIDDLILTSIVECTNEKIVRKANNYTDKHMVRETCLSEITACLGLLYLAGLFRSARQNLVDLWASDGTGIDIFRCTMPLKRFQFLLACLRFDKENTREERRNIDKLAPIRAVFDHFVENCRNSYTPSEYLTIDEKLESFRGRCGFRQYIPNKPAKYGLKVFAMVDAKTFYVLNLEVYVGKQPEGPFQQSNKPEDIVLRLVEPLKNSRRNITFDNWFSSYPLVTKLLKNYGLTSVGTLRKNKREIPSELLNTKNREERSCKFAFQKDVSLVSYVPKKGKNVIVISTLHHSNTIDEASGDLRKPEHIMFYNSTKAGVDVVDELSGTYSVSRNSRRWPLTLFFFNYEFSGNKCDGNLQ